MDVLALGARDLLARLANGEIRAIDLMAATLDRIDALNPRLNAIVARRDREILLNEARAKDAERAGGAAPGLLHGLPMAIKEPENVAGLPTTKGSLILRGKIAAEDAIGVRRLKAAGAIVIGKTNIPEFTFGSYSSNAVYGATGNAYDERLTAGGSSSGAAVALALRMVALADGSDYGGSLRNPAGWNNVYGFRPSWGLTAREDADAWTATMGTLGPMARSVADLAHLLSVQAGYDPATPLVWAQDGAAFRAPLDADLRGRRIAWLSDWGGFMPCEPGVLELARSGLDVLAGLGCEIEEATPDFDPEALWRAFLTLRPAHNFSLLEHYNDPEKRALLPETALYEVEQGLKLSAYEVVAASQVRTSFGAAMRRFFTRFDALALPTAQVFAFPVSQKYPTEIAGRRMATYHEWMKSAVPAAMAGAPALAMPAGFDPEGRAMGLQLIGAPREDFALLQIGHAYDLATRWPDRRLPAALQG